MTKNQGFNLIELIIFIVVLGIAAAGILMSFRVALQTTPDIRIGNLAMAITHGRLEALLGQYKIQGYSFDPTTYCNSPAPDICSIPSGYSIAATATSPWNGNNNFKVLTVTTTEDSTGDTLASLQALVSKKV